MDATMDTVNVIAMTPSETGNRNFDVHKLDEHFDADKTENERQARS